jgi:hypothetical protein
VERIYLFLKVKFMKKLSLNKRVIAQLNNPDNIYGGDVQSRDPKCYDPIHVTSDGQLWEPSRHWNCPSVDITYCSDTKCKYDVLKTCVCPAQ